MKKNAKIQLGDLPKREKSLSLQEIEKVFGGCKHANAPCHYDGECCSGNCLLFSNWYTLGACSSGATAC